ncbi:MAG: DNA-directed RNA polymerase subunit K [Candidatus Freyarchaeota archaeon]|nr:DNA-directed RNA polymerase subunit K [Candidatus Freyrarchaeum guaymaensis]
MEATTIVTETFVIKVGPPWLTRYEKSRILSARALQITLGAPILIDIPKDVKDPITIAKLELEKGILPITIRRSLPDGTYQDIPIRFLTKS